MTGTPLVNGVPDSKSYVRLIRTLMPINRGRRTVSKS